MALLPAADGFGLEARGEGRSAGDFARGDDALPAFGGVCGGYLPLERRGRASLMGMYLFCPVQANALFLREFEDVTWGSIFSLFLGCVDARIRTARVALVSISMRADYL